MHFKCFEKEPYRFLIEILSGKQTDNCAKNRPRIASIEIRYKYKVIGPWESTIWRPLRRAVIDEWNGESQSLRVTMINTFGQCNSLSACPHVLSHRAWLRLDPATVAGIVG